LPLKPWRNKRGGLIKVEPTIMDAVFKQPFFGNPCIPHPIPKELNISAHVGRTMVIAGCTCIKDLWNSIIHYWKEF
jgi:hypothetical protein